MVRGGRLRPLALASVGFLYATVGLFPLLWLLASSFKSNLEVLENPWGLPAVMRFQNYSNAWTMGNLGIYLWNSTYVTLSSLVLGLVVSILAVYPLARSTGKLNRYLYLFIGAGVVIPVNTLLVPLFVMFTNMKVMINNPLSLILIYTAMNIPFNVLILYGFMQQLPVEIDESAIMDGTPVFRLIFSIIIPVLKPALATASVLSFLSKWNELLFAITFITDSLKRTLPAGLATFVGRFTIDYSSFFAGLIVSIIPTALFYIAMQKQVIAGLTAGTVK